MKLKHGKKYETADGVVYRVLERLGGVSFEVSPGDENQWIPNGRSMMGGPDLIRRHYTKPQPAHKLGLKKGDVVELVAWDDGAICLLGKHITVKKNGLPDVVSIYRITGYEKGQRPLFRVVSRA